MQNIVLIHDLRVEAWPIKILLPVSKVCFRIVHRTKILLGVSFPLFDVSFFNLQFPKLLFFFYFPKFTFLVSKICSRIVDKTC